MNLLADDQQSASLLDHTRLWGIPLFGPGKDFEYGLDTIFTGSISIPEWEAYLDEAMPCFLQSL